MTDESQTAASSQPVAPGDIDEAFAGWIAPIERIISTLRPSGSPHLQRVPDGGSAEASVLALAFPLIAARTLGVGSVDDLPTIKLGVEALGRRALPLIIRALGVTKDPAPFAKHVAAAVINCGVSAVDELYRGLPDTRPGDENGWWLLATIVRRAAAKRTAQKGHGPTPYLENAANVRHEMLLAEGKLSGIVAAARAILRRRKDRLDPQLCHEIERTLALLEARRPEVLMEFYGQLESNITWPGEAERLLTMSEGARTVVSYYLTVPSDTMRDTIVRGPAELVVPAVLMVIDRRNKARFDRAMGLLSAFAGNADAYRLLLDHFLKP